MESKTPNLDLAIEGVPGAACAAMTAALSTTRPRIFFVQPEEMEMQTATLEVSGMTCGGCVRSVTNLLKGLDGVAQADVSLEKSSAVIAYDTAKLSVDQIKRAIEEAGYEVAS